jgi:uncharacterized protein (TIGR03435 family)
MKPEKNIDEILDRYITSASTEDVELHCDQVFRQLQSQARETAPHAGPERLGNWRLIGMVSAAATIVLAIVIGVSWRADAPAILESENSRRVEYGETVRSNNVAGSTLVLADKSRIEMRSGSELSLERADDGVRIRLAKGDVIVNAARQHGHLYVQTKDVNVTVTGTVFLVHAEEEGSRVGVIQGEVRVQQGATKTTLLPGEQVMTKPLMAWQPVSEEISWSRKAEAHLALLQQSAVPTRAAPGTRVREAFEVASVRPSSPTSLDGGARGARGSGVGPGGARLQIDPKRFVASNVTLHRLVLLAYGISGFGSDPVYGGPGWMRTDRFDIQAVLPEGSPSYTMNQLLRGEVPILQLMVQTLLADRFKVALHREMKELPVYNLVVVKDGKMKLSDDQTPVNPAAGPLPWRSDSAPPRGAIVLMFNPTGGRTISATAMPISEVAALLGDQLGRGVIDKTNLKGLFDIRLDFAPAGSPDATAAVAPDPAGPYLFDAIQDQLGLKLESTRSLVEVLVIDRAEKPSEN